MIMMKKIVHNNNSDNHYYIIERATLLQGEEYNNQSHTLSYKYKNTTSYVSCDPVAVAGAVVVPFAHSLVAVPPLTS